MGRLGPVGGAARTGRGSKGGCVAVAWRPLVPEMFSKWRFRSGREACEGGGTVWTLPLAKEGLDIGLRPDSHRAEGRHRRLWGMGGLGFSGPGTGRVEQRSGLGSALGFQLRTGEEAAWGMGTERWEPPSCSVYRRCPLGVQGPHWLHPKGLVPGGQQSPGPHQQNHHLVFIEHLLHTVCWTRLCAEVKRCVISKHSKY